ncbi:hypothetical protein [Gluconobacter oxydans]|uniref:hypothetical protein n=1 Tax=Gluconobacter oxydans TaxID=442 RepID=UPI000A942DB4|nr:hypothetical protein [Gluconobacter oxydans]
MKNLKLRKLLLLSHHEKKARTVEFGADITVVCGGNDVGKSHLIKSIYAAFGADAAVVNEKWKLAQPAIAVEFTIDDEAFTILRINNQFGLFDAEHELMWSESALVNEVGRRIAALLNFEIELPTKYEALITPPPQFLFLPFYQDQDRGWNDQWASFKSVSMLPDYRRSILEYHTGIRPREYYQARTKKIEAVRFQGELKAERKALDRATARLQANRTTLGVPFEPEEFAEQIERLLGELNEISPQYETVRKKVSELQSRRAELVEQIVIAGSALQELDHDFRFLQDIADNEITCPTCHAVYENDFAHRFGLIGDADACRGFLTSARAALVVVERDIDREKRAITEFQGRTEKLEAILSETRGKIKLQDMLKDESQRILDSTIAAERAIIQEEIDLWLGKERIASEKMKEYDSPSRKKNILQFYRDKLRAFAEELGVNFVDAVGKSVAPKINETGSYGTRAFIAYNFAVLHTICEYSTSCFAPIVLDTPLQQDQDKLNADAILQFIRDRRPVGTQLIMGTVSLHGVDYPGRHIEPDEEEHLLQADEYADVSAYIAPLFNKMMHSNDSPLLL